MCDFEKKHEQINPIANLPVGGKLKKPDIYMVLTSKHQQCLPQTSAFLHQVVDLEKANITFLSCFYSPSCVLTVFMFYIHYKN